MSCIIIIIITTVMLATIIIVVIIVIMIIIMQAEDFTDEQFGTVFSTNFFSVYRMSKASGRVSVEPKRGVRYSSVK